MKQTFVSLFLFCNILCYGQNTDSVSISVIQPAVYTVKTEWSQQLNFDLSIENKKSGTIELYRVAFEAYDKKGNFISRKTLEDGPLAPSIRTIPARQIRSKETVTLFNPFTVFNPYIDLSHLALELSFKDDSGNRFTAGVDVKPTLYAAQSTLSVPLKGTLFVSDGNDLYANHRRLDINHPLVRDMLDMHSNPELFAVDFTVVDSVGSYYSGRRDNNANHYIFGNTVYAPADGKVIATNNQYEDNKPGTLNFNIQDAKTNSNLLSGNSVVIDHLNGEYSFLVHLQKGSVIVNEGEMVRRGQPIGKVGNSGSSMFPHLHYQLVDKPSYTNSNGLPIYFHHYNLISGNGKVEIKKGYLSTGDIIENN